MLWSESAFRHIACLDDCFFFVPSPIRQMQRPIYLQNYPEVWETALSAPCCYSRCALWLKLQTQINKHLPLLLLTSAIANRPLSIRQVLWCFAVSRSAPVRPSQPPSTPSLSLISHNHGLTLGLELCFWHNTKNNGAFASMAGLASGLPSRQPHLTGADCETRKRNVKLCSPLLMSFSQLFLLTLSLFIDWPFMAPQQGYGKKRVIRGVNRLRGFGLKKTEKAQFCFII